MLNQHTPSPTNEQEEWRPVLGWEQLYEVSNLGRVRASMTRPRSDHRGRILWTRPNIDGYTIVDLSRNGKRIHARVHRLVAEAFLGPCPVGLLTHHEDDDRANPALSNLRYITHLENVRISVERGRHARNKTTSKLTPAQVIAIRADTRRHGVIAAEYGVGKGTISVIKTRRSWADLPGEE